MLGCCFLQREGLVAKVYKPRLQGATPASSCSPSLARVEPPFMSCIRNATRCAAHFPRLLVLDTCTLLDAILESQISVEN